MLRLLTLFGLALLMAACAPTTNFTRADGTTGTARVYRPDNEGRVQLRLAEAVNTLRQATGVAPVRLNSQLNAAAATHARDMAIQNRPWHFGSDGSSPLDRVRRVGYTGLMLGEAISETFETELETLAAWMEDPGTRAVILDPAALDLGFSYQQESNGKLWYTLVMGGAGVTPVATPFPEFNVTNARAPLPES